MTRKNVCYGGGEGAPGREIRCRRGRGAPLGCCILCDGAEHSLTVAGDRKKGWSDCKVPQTCTQLGSVLTGLRIKRVLAQLLMTR